MIRAHSGGAVPTVREAAEEIIKLRRPQLARPEERGAVAGVPREVRLSQDRRQDGRTRRTARTSSASWDRSGTRGLRPPGDSSSGSARSSGGRSRPATATAADPVAGIGEALGKQNGGKQRFRSLPHGEVADALAKIRRSQAWPATRLCIELQILAAVRPSEARLAEWSEIARERRVWTIPPERTKANKLHRVPLSDAALAVLNEAAKLSGPEGLVLPGSEWQSALDRDPLEADGRDLGIPAVAHGFRASFRSWSAEAGAAREVAEAALAHVVRGVEGSYQRSDLFEARADLMARWAEYIGGRDG